MHGMFDKDKEYGIALTAAFAKGESFLLHHAAITADDIPTKIGKARRTTLSVSRLDRERDIVFEVTTLGSAIAEKVTDADPQEFPAVTCWIEVPSNFDNTATVLQWVRNPSEAEVMASGTVNRTD